MAVWELADIPYQYSRLLASRIYHGIRLNAPTPHPVVLLIPGLLAPSASLSVMAEWLRRMGFKPLSSEILSNVDCPNVTYEFLAKLLRAQLGESGQRAYVIGHSLGGTIALGLTISHPELIERGFALGAPLVEARGAFFVSSAVTRLYKSLKPIRMVRGQGHADCSNMKCWCPFRQTLTLESPGKNRFVSIYSPDDSIVECPASDRADVKSRQISGGGHMSLVFNPEVYRLLYEELTCK